MATKPCGGDYHERIPKRHLTLKKKITDYIPHKQTTTDYIPHKTRYD